MSEKAPRPGQATFAAWLIIGGSVILVGYAWQRISTLHTLEVQEQLQRVLKEPPFAGTGLGLEGLKTTIRVLCMVGAAAATASAILGVQALRRSTSARLALTMLAPLVLIGGFATAGFFAPMVVAGVAMLWLRPTRDWFAGRPWLPATAGPTTRRPDPFAPTAPPAAAPEPGPEPGTDEHPVVPPQPDSAGPPAHPVPFASPHGEPVPGPAMPAPLRAPRPASLIAACVLTWVSCAVVSGAMLLLSLVMAVARDDLFDELERQQPDFDMQGMTRAELATGTYLLTAVLLVWCVVAAVLAVLALRRRHGAWIGLTVNTGVVGLVLLGATLLSPPLFVVLVAAVVTLWLLLRPSVTSWFRR
jgi:hypothetical protein